MALICDTGGVFALYDADDAHHAVVAAAVEAEPGPLFLPVLLLTEIDYLLTTRLRPAAALDFLESIEQGTFTVVPLASDDLADCRSWMKQYEDLALGLADASVVVVAERLLLNRLLTLDERHFRTIRPRRFDHFVRIR